MVNHERLEVANAALMCFAKQTWIEPGPSGLVVCWIDFRDEKWRRRWQVRSGQDFYPTWHRHWGHGGTCCTALSQLVRWVRGKPVFSLDVWRYWAGPTVALGRPRGDYLVEALRAGGYPERVPCVLCGKVIEGRFDWYSNNGFSGPGHRGMSTAEGGRRCQEVVE